MTISETDHAKIVAGVIEKWRVRLAEKDAIIKSMDKEIEDYKSLALKLGQERAERDAEIAAMRQALLEVTHCRCDHGELGACHVEIARKALSSTSGKEWIDTTKPSTMHITEICGTCGSSAGMREVLERALAALEFYGDKDDYFGDDEDPPPILDDQGEMAWKVISDLRKLLRGK